MLHRSGWDGGGKDRRPETPCRAASPSPGHKLAIDKIRDAAQKQPYRRGAGDDVADRDPRIASPAAKKQPHGEDHAQKTAVERHAALPDGQRFQRVLQVVSGLVENYVAQASPQHDPQCRPDDEVVDMFLQ